MKSFKQTRLASAISLAVLAPLFTSHSLARTDDSAATQEQKGLEVIEVTAQRRTQSIQEVPISIATLSGDEFENLFSGAGDILEFAVRVPGVYAESSNGRVAPRFYIRGLGNTDFDLAASQPVSIIMDDVVMENVVLKSFPLFDIQQVEVIRGPQGTLFGRNTTAGIIKFDTVKPSEDFDAYVKASYGSFNTTNIEGAIGGGLGDGLSGRISVLSQERDDWIDNIASPEGDAIGGFDEKAWRAQLLYTPNSDLSILAQLHGRDLTGTASIFRANVFTRGSNELNENYTRDKVIYDANLLGNGFDNNPQEYEGFGGSFKVDYDLGDVTITSITAYEEADGFSLGDIDGGFGSAADFTPDPRPGFIPFDAVTRDSLNDLEQVTQEIRFTSNTNDALQWQAGAFYFDSSFSVTSTDGFFGATTVFHDNTTWAVFGQASYELTERLTVTGGVRYTDDEKSLEVGDQNVNGFALVIGAASIQDYQPVNVDDGQTSFELSANYRLTDDVSLFARFANGFRAQSIQGRDIAFEGNPSVADAETINSIEGGIKADLLDDTLRINAALFAYEVDDIQLSAIGGANNGNSLLNADKGRAFGFEIDARYLVTENFEITAGFSLNDTELQDDTLLVAPCGANCTVLDPLVDGLALVDGNPFPQAPETIFNFTARYAIPFGDDGEIFVFTDWAFQGDTNLFLYDAIEFTTDDQFEGGLRVGYQNFSHGYTFSMFARNITDEDNVKGAIDFNNLTGIVNDPRIVGIEAKFTFY
uniref:TonB-dependent receptor n=1 Tax=Ningiella ruwaisensis TaxID=2364274 RepID=UPI00109FEC7B|nr:TonB-dependent receptor [Ningiella ruwaisensis]